MSWGRKALSIRLTVLALLGLVLQLGFGFEAGLGWPAMLPVSTIFLIVGVNVFTLMIGRGGLWPSSLAMAAVTLASFPWWARGFEGWIAFGSIVFCSLILLGSPKVVEGVWLPWVQRALFAALALVMCLSTSSIAHMTVLAAMLIPVALLATFDTFKNNQPWAAYGDRWLMSSVALVLGNALIRYVPDPDVNFPEKPILYTSGFLFALGLQMGRIRLKSPWKIVVLSLVLPLLAAIMALFVYTYEGEAQDDGPGYDYGSFS